MRKLVVTLLAALAVMLPALAVATPAQAATDPAPTSTTTTLTPEQQAAAEQAAADKAAAQKAAKEKARKQRIAKKRAAEKRKLAREMRVWNRLAHCESTGRWFVDTGNGYYGGLQISPSTWRAYGGARFAGLPHRASKVEQVKVAKRIKNGQGWGAWPSCSRKIGVR